MQERGLFDTIVGSFRQRLSLLPDKRTGKNTRYGMEDAALSAFSVFFTQDPSSDRPAHVRAGSSLSWLGDKLALIQDDANFLVLIDPESLTVEAITLVAGEAGARQFDDLRGNKRFKLDLEACTTVATPKGDLFLAFGSGSTAQREKILIVESSNLVGSRRTIKSCPSHLDLDVPISVHPAPDFLGSCLACASHVDVIVAALMDNYQVIVSPV